MTAGNLQVPYYITLTWCSNFTLYAMACSEITTSDQGNVIIFFTPLLTSSRQSFSLAVLDWSACTVSALVQSNNRVIFLYGFCFHRSISYERPGFENNRHTWRVMFRATHIKNYMSKDRNKLGWGCLNLGISLMAKLPAFSLHFRSFYQKMIHFRG